MDKERSFCFLLLCRGKKVNEYLCSEPVQSLFFYHLPEDKSHWQWETGSWYDYCFNRIKIIGFLTSELNGHLTIIVTILC